MSGTGGSPVQPNAMSIRTLRITLTVLFVVVMAVGVIVATSVAQEKSPGGYGWTHSTREMQTPIRDDG